MARKSSKTAREREYTRLRAIKSAAPADGTKADEKRIMSDRCDLRDSMVYWFFERGKRKLATMYADLLEKLFDERDTGSICFEESRSLIAEVRGNLPGAIRYRRREIFLIRHLHDISVGTPNEKFIFEVAGHDFLSDRLDHLATLLHAAGKKDQAIAVLKESRQLCELHGFVFEGTDLLAKYLEESQAMRGKKSKALPRRG